MYKIGWFSTANGKTSQLLLSTVMDNIQTDQLKAEIAFVFVSREQGENLETDNFINMVEGYNLPLVTFSFDKFRALHSDLKRSQVRELYDTKVIEMLKAYPCDLAVLAGYMLIISSQMCETYDMINLHPALPGGPKGTWREVIWQLIEQKAVESGAMMHLVTPELDCGPVATYCRYNLRSADFDELWQQAERQSMQEIRETQGEYSLLFQKIRNEGIRREFPLIVYSLRSFIEGHVYIKDHAIYDKDHKLIDGYDISTVIK